MPAARRSAAWAPSLRADCTETDDAVPGASPVDVAEEHRSPAPWCECGIYGWYQPNDTAMLDPGPFGVFGVIQASGLVLMGDSGFRAERAEIVAVVTRLVLVINAEMAHQYWPNRNPIGERIWFDAFDPKPERWYTVVGVAGDVRHSGLTELVHPEAYVSYAQIRLPAMLVASHLILRAAGDPSALAPAVRKALREVHPEAAVSFRTMDDVLAAATDFQQFTMKVPADARLPGGGGNSRCEHGHHNDI